MSSEKTKPNSAKSSEGKKRPSPAAPATKAAITPDVPTGPVPPLFKAVDWLTFAITALVVFIGYYFTLAPDLTLEDSGELAVGSMYAGVPHPPGYPVWTIFTWLFTELVPFSNIAWRVALGSAFAAAVACGLIGMMVSRGSAMIIDSFEQLKGIEPRVEKALCVVSGYVAGMLMAFNGFMWSQAVIVEVYAISVLSLAGVMIFMFRWMHAPHQRWYLYAALFLFGICFTNHQTLVVAAIGIEVAVLARDAKLGRDLFFGNSIIFALVGLALLMKHGRNLDQSGMNLSLLSAFFAIGLVSVVVTGWMVMHTSRLGSEWKSALIMMGMWLLGASFYFYMPLAGMTNPPMQWGYPRTVEGFIHALTRGQYEKANPTSGLDRFFGQLQAYAEGAIEEFNLVYLLIGLVPLAVIFYRRIEQEEKIWLGAVSALYSFLCLLLLVKDFAANKGLIGGMLYGYVFLLIGIIPFLFFRHTTGGRPERAWLAGLTTTFLFLSLLLIFLLNPPPDRQSQQLNRVFFTASYVPVCMGIGYGVAMIGAALVAQYATYRRILLGACAGAAGVAWYALDRLEVQHPLAVFTAQFALALAAAGIFLFAMARTRVPVWALLGLFAVMPAHTILSHWSDNEQRGHLFGYWFGHDMFSTDEITDDQGRPIYPPMAADAVLFGGTDPGRFCPTYMIFCESFIKPEHRRDPKFDRRDVYLITQNALADATYLMYIRAHYNRSAQVDPRFFTGLVDYLQTKALRKPDSEKKARGEPYRLGAMGNMLALANVVARPLDSIFTSLGGRIEKKRRVGPSYFEPEHFTDVAALTARLRPGSDQNPLDQHLQKSLSPATRELLGAAGREGALRSALARDFNQLLDAGALYETNRFERVELSPRLRRFIAENPQGHTRVRLNRQLLEAAFPKEIAISPGGLYPDLEIHTPSIPDSSAAFAEYVADAQKRLEHDLKFPKEQKQIRPGEDVKYDPATGRIQVSGQIAVMAINGLLTKVIFDKNPHHEFYVEESFPLDWMYPYLTPAGIIMKINREPLPEITQDIVDRDHRFWSKYSERLIGNWITYDTPVSNICHFAEQTYLRRNYSGMKLDGKEVRPDSRFVRDDDAQKAFSKLRSAIAGVYFWRINEALRRNNIVEHQRMIRECEFAFKQALAFCPFSPEAVFRYTNLLVSLNRLEDALAIARTFRKLDPNNATAQNLVSQLEAIKQSQGAVAQAQNQIQQLQGQFKANPTNTHLAFNLFSLHLQLGQTNQAVSAMDVLMSNPNADGLALLTALQAYGQIGHANRIEPVLRRLVTVAGQTLANPQSDIPALQIAAQALNYAGDFPRLEQVMHRMLKLTPESAESWYDLSRVQAHLARTNEALHSVSNAIRLSRQRSAQQPGLKDLRAMAAEDGRLQVLRGMPGFQQLVAPTP